MTVRVELKKDMNGRFLSVVHLCAGPNVWMHSSGDCSYVPTKAEAQLIMDGIEICDTYNALKKNLRFFDQSEKRAG